MKIIKHLAVQVAFLVCIINFYAYLDATEDYQKQNESISSFIQAVHYRYYLIARLKEAISIIKQEKNDFFVDIKNEVAVLLEKWKVLAAYQMIQDKDYELDVAKGVLKLLQKIVNKSERKAVLPCHYSMEYILNVIDTHLNKNKAKDLSLNVLSFDEVPTDLIVARFYAIKRLKNAFELLAYVDKKMLICPVQPKQMMDVVLDVEWNKVFSFISDKKMEEVLNEVVQTGSVKPILRVWNECVHYRYIGNDLFLKDSMIMLIGAYKNLIVSNVSTAKQKKKLAYQMHYVMDLYKHMDQYDTEELLDAIDGATYHFLVIVKEIEKSISWYVRLYDWILSKIVVS